MGYGGGGGGGGGGRERRLNIYENILLPKENQGWDMGYGE